MYMEDHVKLGREVVKDGRLKELRAALGWSRNAMAEALLTSPITYSAWEAYPDTRLWPSTSERIGKFYEQAITIAISLDIDNYLPFYYLASELGIPQEELMKRHREGKYAAEDLGVLGLWIHQDEYARITGVCE